MHHVLTYSELVALVSGKVDKEAMANSNASARARSCSAAPAGARSDFADVRISGSAVTRRFQIDAIRLQLKLGRRPQSARLIS
jgi:hypothetical protein